MIDYYITLQTYLFYLNISWVFFFLFFFLNHGHWASFFFFLSWFPRSSELSKKFLKSCRLNDFLCGRRNSAKSRRYIYISYIVIDAVLVDACVCGEKWPVCRFSLSVMSGSSAPWGKARGSGRCATVPGELSATFSCWSAYEPRRIWM